MKLSIIVPIYNEEKTVQKAVFRTQKIFNRDDCEIILVNDGSTDWTRNIIENIKDFYSSILQKTRINTIHHEKNQGKGSAIQSGLKKAAGDYIAIQDADLEYDPKNLYELWKIACQKEAVVYGKRNGEKGYMFNRLGNKILSLFCNILFGSGLSDIYTCYKIIPRQLMSSLDLKSNGFEIEAEITAKILKRKIGIIEKPIAYSPRTFSEGKHICWKDGYKGILTLLKIKIGKKL